MDFLFIGVIMAGEFNIQDYLAEGVENILKNALTNAETKGFDTQLASILLLFFNCKYYKQL